MKTTSGMDSKHLAFSKPPLHIPNAVGVPYKTELVEVRDPEGETIKWNFWHLPDDDREPHNHPWEFTSTVIHGGYTEIRYWLDRTYAGTVLDERHGPEVIANVRLKWQVITHKKGDVIHVPRSVFHLVTDVDPGTVTRMVCGPIADGGEWGYLDPKTLVYRKAEPDPSFISRLRSCNLFLKDGGK